MTSKDTAERERYANGIYCLAWHQLTPNQQFVVDAAIKTSRTPVAASEVVERHSTGVWMMKGRECQSVAREIVEDVVAALNIPLHDFRKRDEAITGCLDTVQKVMDEAALASQQPVLSPLNSLAHEIEDKACEHCDHVTKAGEHHSHPCSADSGHPDDTQQPDMMGELVDAATTALSMSKSMIDGYMRDKDWRNYPWIKKLDTALARLEQREG